MAIPFVSATEQTYKSGDEIDIKRECFYDGDVCTGDFNCTLTVYNPNGTTLVDNQKMTNSTGYYNYTLGPIFLNGEYRNRMTCTNGVDSGSEIFYFDVTPGGNYNVFLILGLSALILLAFAYFFKDNVIGFIAGVVFIVVGVYTMIYGVADLSNIYTRAISFISIGLGLLFAIAGAYNLIENN